MRPSWTGCVTYAQDAHDARPSLRPPFPSRAQRGLSSEWLWVALSVLWVFAALPSGFVAIVSGLLFDAPGSENSPLTVALARTMLALPFAWLAGAGLPWAFRGKRFARWLFLLPFLNLAVTCGIGLAIHVRCGGKLVCR